jgi:hypothetical protein
MDWQTLGPLVPLLLGWLAWSLLVAVVWVVFATGAFHKGRRLPRTTLGLRAWVAGDGGPRARRRAKPPPSRHTTAAVGSRQGAPEPGSADATRADRGAGNNGR